MLKTNRTSFKIGILILGVVLILMFGIKWTIQFFRIDACLDKGGKWNYDLNECDCLYNLDSAFMAETVFTLSENDLIKFIRIEMDYGSHAGPGLYSRKNYERMIRQ